MGTKERGMCNRNKLENKTEQFRGTMVLFHLNAHEDQKIKRFAWFGEFGKLQKRGEAANKNLGRWMGLGQAKKNAQCLPEKGNTLRWDWALLSEEDI